MAVNLYNRRSDEVIEDLLKEKGIELRKGKNVKGAKYNNGGIPLSNMTTKQAIEWLTTRTACG